MASFSILKVFFFVIITLVISSLFLFLAFCDQKKHILKLKNLIIKYKASLKKYSTIINIEKEVDRLSNNKNKLVEDISELGSDYKKLKSIRDIYYEDVDLISQGHYKMHYDFEKSERYKERLNKIRGEQKNLIKNKEAIVCPTSWAVGQSEKDGKQMINRVIKLGLNAFNVQTDNVILKVNHNNIHSSEERVENIYEKINKLLNPLHCEITDKFYQLKLEELYLAFEYKEKVFEEKEEQKEIKLRMREEAKAKKEYQQEIERAKAEEVRYNQALEEAKQKLEEATEEKFSEYKEHINNLQKKLDEVRAKERALSQAQLTSRGHVYVISNEGSFGENVFKVGMTRRLDPMERVKELGDASVPFGFDVHAIIFSEEAPKMEKELHRIFDTYRINKINNRKEFFRIDLDYIENACRQLGAKVQFTKLAEAYEYKESLKIEQELKKESFIEHENANNGVGQDTKSEDLIADEILKKVS